MKTIKSNLQLKPRYLPLMILNLMLVAAFLSFPFLSGCTSLSIKSGNIVNVGMIFGSGGLGDK